jgi:hypothetical protein
MIIRVGEIVEAFGTIIFNKEMKKILGGLRNGVML